MSNKGNKYNTTLTPIQGGKLPNVLTDNNLQDTNPLLESKRGVDLSYCSQSRRFFIRIDKYKNGEAKIKTKTIVKKELNDLLREEFTMPRRSGEIYQNGLTNKAKSKIKLASRMIQHQVLNQNSKGARPYASFITLTYGLHYPSDHVSKKHLEHFIKRIKRVEPDFQFIWVIEKQKRGAPHFHILTPNYIDKEVINKAWNGVVSKWQKSEIDNGCKQQTVYPNVGKVFEAGKYMTKYMQKQQENIGGNMYGIDYKTRKLMKSETISIEAETNLNDIAEHLSVHLKTKEGVTFTCQDFNGNNQYWISELNEFNLNEFLDYTVPELQLKIHQSEPNQNSLN